MNSDTGKPMIVDDSRLTAGEFDKIKIAETIETRGDKSCRPLHSPLWLSFILIGVLPQFRCRDMNSVI